MGTSEQKNGHTSKLSYFCTISNFKKRAKTTENYCQEHFNWNRKVAFDLTCSYESARGDCSWYTDNKLLLGLLCSGKIWQRMGQLKNFPRKHGSNLFEWPKKDLGIMVQWPFERRPRQGSTRHFKMYQLRFSWRSSFYSISFCLLLTMQEKHWRHVKARNKTEAGGRGIPACLVIFFSFSCVLPKLLLLG